jgi:hypothetical protein
LDPDRVVASILDKDRFDPLVRYYNRILPDIQRRCDARGVRLVVVQLFFRKQTRGAEHTRGQRMVRRRLQAIAQRHGMELYDTEALFSGREDCFLPHDGHLNAMGHRRLADYLAEQVLARDR